MSESLQRAGAFFLFATAATVLSPGCAVNESSLFIRGCLVVPQDTCEVSPDPTAAMQSSGVLDASFATAYFASLLVGNQLVTRGDPNRLRTETSRVEITGADVTVTDPGGKALPRSQGGSAAFFTATSGFVDPSSGGEPGYGVANVQLIDPALAADLRSQGGVHNVQAHVVLHGRSLGGTELTSGEWIFPIVVCSGCLCDRSACGSTDGGIVTDTPPANCHVGTDAPVDCRLNLMGCP